jgi:uncharacterized membrane protein YdjX (TVP38/TMEM64 family)
LMVYVKRFGPIALIAGCLALVFAMGWHKYLSFDVLAQQSDALKQLLATKPLVVIAAFMTIYIIATAIALPGAIWLTIGGGFLFGPFLGTALSATSATIGASILFVAAQSALGEGLRGRAGGLIDRLESGFRENAFSYLLTLRLVPIAPFFGVNLAAAFLRIPLRTFVLATAIGILPGGFVYAWLGSGIEHIIAAGGTPDLKIIFSPQVIGPLLGLAALALLPTVWKFVSQRGRVG